MKRWKIYSMSIKKGSITSSNRLEKLTEDMLRVLERWNKLHKEREKNLRYIG